MELSTYLFFNGKCREAFQFYEKTLNGKIELMMTYGESPEKDKCTPGTLDQIMHVRLKLGNYSLMASDAPSEHYQKPQGFSVSYAVDSKAEAERIFKALSDNGKIIMPLEKTFWAEAFGMCVDRFGISWMVNCEH
jgi:PhnB protein